MGGAWIRELLTGPTWNQQALADIVLISGPSYSTALWGGRTMCAAVCRPVTTLSDDEGCTGDPCSASGSEDRNKKEKQKRVNKQVPEPPDVKLSLRRLCTSQCLCAGKAEKRRLLQQRSSGTVAQSCFREFSQGDLFQQLCDHRMAYAQMHKLDQDRQVSASHSHAV